MRLGNLPVQILWQLLWHDKGMEPQSGVCLSTEVKQIPRSGSAVEEAVAEAVGVCKLENCVQIKFRGLCSNAVPFCNTLLYL